MSDQTQGPQDPTEAKPVASTFGQQLIIAVLVVGVGVLFGMAPVIGVLQQGGAQELLDGVTDVDTDNHRVVSTRLQEIINPRPNQFFNPEPLFMEGRFIRYNFVPNNSRDAYASRLFLAEVARQEGLMPTGSNLNELFEEWKATPLPMDDSQNYGMALDAHIDSPRGVGPMQAQDWVAVDYAVDALFARHVGVPAMPLTSARGVAGMGALAGFGVPGDTVLVDVATLRADVLLTDELIAAARADEGQLQITYDDLRDRFFAIPEQRELTLFVADADSLAARIAISDEEAKARYEATKEAYRNTEMENARRLELEAARPEGDTTPVTVEPIYNAYETVAPDIKTDLALEEAIRISNVLAGKLQQTLVDGGFVGNADADRDEMRTVAAAVSVGPDEFPKLDSPVAISVVDQVRAGRPEDGSTMVDLGSFGQIDSTELDLFSTGVEAGFLSGRYQPKLDGLSGDRANRSLFILVDAVISADYEDFESDTVKDQLARWQATQDLWADLLATAEELKTKAGEQGLATLFETDDALLSKWKPNVIERTLQPLDELGAPGQRVDDEALETVPAMAMGAGAPELLVVLPPRRFSDTIAADVPRIELVQFKSYEKAEPLEAERVTQLTATLDQQISGMLESIYRTELAERSEGN